MQENRKQPKQPAEEIRQGEELCCSTPSLCIIIQKNKQQHSDLGNEALVFRLGNSSLSASTLVTVQILDVNDNSPVLVGDYSWKYLCTPRWEDQALVLASRDSDGPQHGGRLNFSLRSDATVRRNWKLTPINGEVNAEQANPVDPRHTVLVW